MHREHALAWLKRALAVILLGTLVFLIVIFFVKIIPDICGYHPEDTINMGCVITFLKEQSVWMLLALAAVGFLLLYLIRLIVYRRLYFRAGNNVIYYHGHHALDARQAHYLKGVLEVETSGIVFTPLDTRISPFNIPADRIIEVVLEDKKFSALAYWLLNKSSVLPSSLIAVERTYIKIKYRDEDEKVNTVVLAALHGSPAPAALKEKLVSCRDLRQ